ncbi:hypothetical protein M1349_04720, partial [Patescibacteria group bacterium]|nr:hypothetical protein [Patescibacteria group bacterium]
TVPTGSTALFSASGNITVDRSIGEAYNSNTSSLEGTYSADNNFIADGYNNCSTQSDLRLNIAGNVIANAGGSGGTLQNNRDLCSGNSDCPAIYVNERPDFVLNSPGFIANPRLIWQEIAP